MNEHIDRQSTDVIVGVDGSEGSCAALCWAVQTASLHGYAVRAVLAADARPVRPHHFRGTHVPELRHILGDAYVLHSTVGRADAPEWIPIAERVAAGSPADVLVRAAGGAAMLVVGRSHQGAGNRWAYRPPLGLRCARLGAVPTVVVHDHPGAVDLADAQPVVVGVDSSPASLEALHWAACEASLRHVQLIVVHTWPTVLAGPSAVAGDQTPSDSTYAHTRPDDPYRPDNLYCVHHIDARGFRWPETEDRLAAGDTAAALLAAAERAQLLVLSGSTLEPEASNDFGRVGERCVAEAACTVAVVPGSTADVTGAKQGLNHLVRHHEMTAAV
jgi:nucleotide-binding universal stress UspA family protein